MKKFFPIFVLVAALALTACRNDVYNSLPQPIATFIDKYYPDPDVGNYINNSSGYRVDILNGPTFLFDNDFKWTEISGNGQALPEILLFDQLPVKVYNYLVETNYANVVFKITRNDKCYKVFTVNYNITYDIESGNITGSTP